jgi:uroporphyrinogen-III decarboxylase
MSTPRERFLKVFNGDKPDRVPVTLFIHDHGHFLSQLYPDLDPWDWAARQAKVVELQQQLGCDVFVRLANYVDSPGFMTRGELDTEQQTATWQVKIEQTGSTQLATITTPSGVLTQHLTLQQIAPGTYVTACTKPAIESPHDLAIVMEYEPPLPERWAQQIKTRVQAIRSLVGDDGVIGLWTIGGPFNYASRLVKLETLYTLFLTDYEFYEQLMSYALRRIQAFCDLAAPAGVDVFIVGGNVPGGFLGRRAYDRYVLPFEKRCIDQFQQHGTPALYHNCGQIMGLVESYKTLGARIIEPFSPPPTLGDADLGRAIDLIHGDYAVIGGVDQVNVLKNGSADEVRRATEQTIQTGKRDRQRGLFILQSADFLEYGTPPENVAAYVEVAQQWAAY